MVVIVRDVAGCAVPDVAWRVGVCIPDRLSFAVLFGCPFDLVRGRGDAPIKILRKFSFPIHASPLLWALTYLTQDRNTRATAVLVNLVAAGFSPRLPVLS